MKYTHSSLANGGWSELSLVNQIANIGSEVERLIKWKKKGRQDISNRALGRCLELIQLSKMATNDYATLKELSRMYELLIDCYWGENEYKSSDKIWKKFFHGFSVAARNISR